MRSFVISVLLLTTVIGLSNAQNVEIPDTAFLYALINEGVDTNGDSLISYTEAEVITYLQVDDEDISDMTGIESFINLDTLYCSWNELTSLDLSNCTALKTLDCMYNQLISLDVSNNTILTELICYDNQLTSLDVSNCIALESLSCEYNQLSSLDVSNCGALRSLWCDWNQLTSLDVSNNTILTDLDCYDNQLTSLNVSGCNALQGLNCKNNQLTSLDVSGCTAIRELHCESNQLTSLNVPDFNALTYLICENNQLTSLDVSGCTALPWLDCENNQLTSLDVSGCTALRGLEFENNQLTSLDVSGCTALQSLDCKNNQLTSLDVSNISLLEYLNCWGNQLINLDISNNNRISWLDVSMMPTLYEVCVKSLPFPPHGFTLKRYDSPNIYFTTECGALHLIAADSVYQQDSIEVYSTGDGIIYLVPQDTEKDIAAIRGACIDSALAVANTSVDVPLTGVENGEYWLYGRDSTDRISEPEAFTIFGVGIDNVFTVQFKIYPNPANDLLTIETNQPGQYFFEITSLNGQLLYTNKMEGPTHQIDLSSYEKGLYFITVRSRDFVKTERIIKQ